MESPATATENPNWKQMQEVTAKLRQTEKQAERIKDTILRSKQAICTLTASPVSRTRAQIH